MSLKHVAHHLASKGRGPDRTLVHMSPDEVRGLQAIAKAHGGSLTINPETGLAEAGFLHRLMPALAGAGLMMIPGMQAAGAAAILGGGTALATGDLKKGLMAGIGAYGGAGLANGALTAGATPGGDAVLAEGATGTGAGAGTTATVAPTGVGADVNGLTMDSGLTTNVPTESIVSQPAQTAQSGIDIGGPGSSPANMGQPQQAGFDWNRVGRNFNADPKLGIAAIAPALNTDPRNLNEEEKYDGPLSQYKFDPNKYRSASLSQPNPYYQSQMYNYADGGPIERMSNENEVGANTGYPGADINQGAYATPWQTPVSRNVVTGSADVGVNPMNGEMNFAGGGGISSLGSYSDGGRMLKGPGDGMSDSIPAKIGSKQPARLADGEFVVPADVVSHLGNGSTDAGARQLYSMMDRIRSQRTGKKKQAPKVNPSKAMPA